VGLAKQMNALVLTRLPEKTLSVSEAEKEEHAQYGQSHHQKEAKMFHC